MIKVDVTIKDEIRNEPVFMNEKPDDENSKKIVITSDEETVTWRCWNG